MKIHAAILFTVIIVALAFVFSAAAQNNTPETQEQAQQWEYVQLVYWFDTQRISIYAATATLMDVAEVIAESDANLLTGDNGLMEYMNVLGDNGWELLSTSEHYSERTSPDGLSLFFKHPKHN